MEPGIEAELLEYWRGRKKLIDAAIESLLESAEEAGAIEVAKYIARGGKRFRGVLVMLSCEALGGTPQEALDAAVAVELVHAASLALDDIIDHDMFRRGRPAAWVVHGISRTVLISNFVIPLAQKLVERYGFRAVQHTIQSWLDVTRGEILDVFNVSPSPKAGPGLYEKIIDLKTGSLFQLSVDLGIIAAGERKYNGFPLYGRLLGKAYQVADDIVDLKLIAEGKLKEIHPILNLAAEWMAGREVKLPEEAEVAVECGIRKLRSLVAEAMRLADTLPATRFREYLKAIPIFMASKMLEESGLSL